MSFDERDLWALLAIAARVWGLLRVQPLWRAALGGAWEVAALLIAVVLSPFMVTASRLSVIGQVDGWLLVGGEFVVGTLIGLVAALPGHALLGSQAIVAERLRIPPGTWRSTSAVLALAFALALDLQRPLLLALRETFTLWPAGAVVTVDGWEVLLPALEELGLRLPMLATGALWLALALATPVLLVNVLVELVLGFSQSGQAQLETADPLRAMLTFSAALIALGASWAAYPESWAHAVLPVAGLIVAP